jgi:hypothetical protein
MPEQILGSLTIRSRGFSHHFPEGSIAEAVNQTGIRLRRTKGKSIELSSFVVCDLGSNHRITEVT